MQSIHLHPIDSVYPKTQQTLPESYRVLKMFRFRGPEGKLEHFSSPDIKSITCFDPNLPELQNKVSL